MIEAPASGTKASAVLGLARSGLAAARALKSGGARGPRLGRRAGTARAKRKRPACASSISRRRTSRACARSCCRPASRTRIRPLIRSAARAKSAGIPIIGDIELLARSCPSARYVGITGTNGKSTTTALLGHILRSGGTARRGRRQSRHSGAAARGARRGRHLRARNELLSARARSTRSPSTWRCCSTSRPIISTGTAAWRAISPPRSASSRASRSARSRSSASTMRSAAASPRSFAPRRAARRADLGRAARRPAASMSTMAGSSTTPSARRAASSISARSTRLPGRHNWQNAAAAFAAARCLGLSADGSDRRHRAASPASPIARS